MLLKIKLALTAFLITVMAGAQMPDDGFTMRKGELCLVAGFKQTKWKEYWEGERLRNNKNLGTFTSVQYMPMAGYGITDRLNVFAGLPYINNSSSAGWMMPMQGWQDISLALKYRVLEVKKSSMTYTLFGTISGSLPSNKYVPDFLPFSIGTRSKTFSPRAIVHLRHKSNAFFTAQAGYVFRSNITVDRSTYYTDEQFYSNEMAVPDVVDGSLKAGFANSRFRAYAVYSIMHSTSGSDIRRNDMPYPGNQMNMQTVGVHALLWVPGINGLGLNAGAEQTIAGRNVGKAFMWTAALQYVFKPFAKKTASATN